MHVVRNTGLQGLCRSIGGNECIEEDVRKWGNKGKYLKHDDLQRLDIGWGVDIMLIKKTSDT